MVLISYNTFEWESLAMVLGALLPTKARVRQFVEKLKTHHISRIDACCIVLVVVLTVIFNLFVGVAGGVLLVSVAYSWQVRPPYHHVSFSTFQSHALNRSAQPSPHKLST